MESVKLSFDEKDVDVRSFYDPKEKKRWYVANDIGKLFLEKPSAVVVKLDPLYRRTAAELNVYGIHPKSLFLSDEGLFALLDKVNQSEKVKKVHNFVKTILFESFDVNTDPSDEPSRMFQKTVFVNNAPISFVILTHNSEDWFLAKSFTDCLMYKCPRKAIQEHVHINHVKRLNEFQSDRTVTNNVGLGGGRSESLRPNPIDDFILNCYITTDNAKEKSSTSRNILFDIQQTSLFINEAGIYELIQGSRMPAATQFKNWINEKLLPGIRKNRRYDSDTIEGFVFDAVNSIIPSEEKRTTETGSSENNYSVKLYDDHFAKQQRENSDNWSIEKRNLENELHIAKNETNELKKQYYSRDQKYVEILARLKIATNANKQIRRLQFENNQSSLEKEKKWKRQIVQEKFNAKQRIKSINEKHQSEIDTLNDQITSLKQKNTDLSITVDKLKNNIASLESEMNAVRKKGKKRLSDEQQRNEIMIKRLRLDLETKQQSYEKLNEKYVATCLQVGSATIYKEQNQRLDQRLTEKETEIKKKDTIIQKKEILIEKKDTAIEEKNRMIIETSRRFREASETSLQLKNENNELRYVFDRTFTNAAFDHIVAVDNVQQNTILRNQLNSIRGRVVDDISSTPEICEFVALYKLVRDDGEVLIRAMRGQRRYLEKYDAHLNNCLKKSDRELPPFDKFDRSWNWATKIRWIECPNAVTTWRVLNERYPLCLYGFEFEGKSKFVLRTLTKEELLNKYRAHVIISKKIRTEDLWEYPEVANFLRLKIVDENDVIARCYMGDTDDRLKLERTLTEIVQKNVIATLPPEEAIKFENARSLYTVDYARNLMRERCNFWGIQLDVINRNNQTESVISRFLSPLDSCISNRVGEDDGYASSFVSEHDVTSDNTDVPKS